MLIIGHKNPDTDSVVSALVLAQVREKIGHKNQTPARAGELNNETKFVLKQLKVKAPKLAKDVRGKEIFLVDHNAAKESPAGREQAILRGVLDHHYLSGLETVEPIYFRCKPVGSTSTLVARLAAQNNVKLSKTQAGLLLAGILSDTLAFASPTTTREDEKRAREMQKISGLKINVFAQQMFEAKSSLAGIKISEIVGKDYKEYSFGQTKFGFGVWETVLAKPLLAKKEELKKSLAALKKKNKQDFIFFAVVDIFKNQSHWVVLGEAEKTVIEKVFKFKEKDGVVFMPEIVSRKKQMVPSLGKYFQKHTK